MKRFFDIVLSIFLLLVFLIPIIIIGVIVKLSSKGPILYCSDRVGRKNVIFQMPKFRSMKIGTPIVATHLLESPDIYLSPIGKFLRSSSLDELPQLFSIFKGDMSFVGPRPALFNQDDLIKLRNQKNLIELVPGLTGWAQVNGRDDLSIKEKVRYEEEYSNNMSFIFDLKILWLTILKVLKKQDVSH
jgi:O-antigen biosynthesis protein WbqP